MSFSLTTAAAPATVVATGTRDLGDPRFWLDFAPGLHIGDPAMVQGLSAITPAEAEGPMPKG